VDKFSIGAETVKGAQIGVMETDGQLNVDILLGADFLRAHRVLFAMSQKKLYLSYVGGDVFKQRRGIEPWMEHEADTGNADAQYVLARAHASGRGVPKDPGKAQAWMDKAAALGHPQANLQVGHAMMARERWTEAASHFRTVLDKLPSEHGAALWLYLARLHTGEAELGKRELEAAFAQGERDEWPTPIADFYLGQIDAAALLDAAGKQGKQSTSRTCSATGFMADWYKAKGDSAQADAMRASWRAHCAAPAPQPAAT
jgi:TPR repeat protein